MAVLPLSSAEESVKEMRVSKDNGALGLFFRGLERDLNLDDPHFFPIYEEARKLDLSICIHTGAGAPTISNLFDLERHSVFAQGRLLPIIAFITRGDFTEYRSGGAIVYRELEPFHASWMILRMGSLSICAGLSVCTYLTPSTRRA